MATDDDDKRDPTVKQLIERGLDKPLKDVVDEVTAAELEKWFGLPSYQQVEEGEVKIAEEDPDMVAVRERRQKAIAAVDPLLLDSIQRRAEGDKDLLRFKATIKMIVDPSLALFDMAMIENKLSIAEPRERERPEDIEDQLKDATPQALLRDLHRPELEFEKLFEVVDMAAEQRLDVVAAVAEAMATNWKLPPLDDTPMREARKVVAELHAERAAPWPAILTRVRLPNRRVTE